jgi:hypothetical protein
VSTRDFNLVGSRKDESIPKLEKDIVNQALATFYVVRATSAKFGLNVGNNIKFGTKNEDLDVCV